MKILDIEIINNKLIRCFKKHLGGDNLEIAGDTSTGKTTAISALWEIMYKHPDTLTKGQKTGTIKIVLGDNKTEIIATRKNTKSTSTITLLDSKGDKIKIEDFKEMISSLSINPHKILDLKGYEQVEALLKAAEMGDFDLEKVDKDITDAEIERLTAFRLQEITKPGPEPEKAQRVDIGNVIKERDAAKEQNDKQGERRVNMVEYERVNVSMSENIKQKLERIVEIKKELHQIDLDYLEESRELEERSKKLEAGKVVVLALKDIDLTPFDVKINNAQAMNDKASKHVSWQEKNKDHEKANESHRKLNERVKSLRSEKEEALDNAKWPLDGLSIEDGEITYEGHTMKNLGESKQMLICAALAIADIKAHPLKVVRIDGVESMSSEDFSNLKALFNGEGIQVLSTRVSRGEIEPQEIQIVDGEYKE